jgi:hypothetical protein
MKNDDIEPVSKSKLQSVWKSPGIKVLIGLVLIGNSLARIVYATPLGDPDQEIGAKIAILGLLIAGISLIVSGVKRWKKD